jgi:hypothetical protein
MLKTLKSISKFVLIPALAFGSLVSSAVPASSSGSNSISLYFSAPFVRASHVSGPRVYTETFNGYANSAACGNLAGAWTFSGTGCGVGTNTYDDTSVLSPEPRIGGEYSKFAYGSMNATYTFTNDVKYVGFWWMWGSDGNSVQFLDANDNVLATMNSSTVSSFFSGKTYVPRVDGGQHTKSYYYGSPAAHYSGTPEVPVVTYVHDEPFIYLNLFVSGTTGVKKIKLSGSGFEFDNLTVALDEFGPRGDMVPVSNVLGSPPSAQVVRWEPEVSNSVSRSPLTPSVAAATSTPAAGTGGAISYSLADAGTAGCSVNSSTGVITATTTGTCRVTAVAAAGTFGGTTYYQGSTNKTFTFTAATSTPPSSSNNSGSSGQSAFSVTYEANGANGFRYHTSGTTKANLHMNNFQKPGHYFVGWNTKPDGTGLSYADRAMFGYSSDLVLYAQWAKVTAKHLVTTFNADKPVLLKSMKNRLRAWAKTLPTDSTLTCEGSTSGAKVRAFDRKLAKARATNSCDFIKLVRPDISYKVTLNPASATAIKARHAWIYLDSNS